MTREEILNMPAGIEMDMLIATQVFNRKAHPSKNKILGQVGRYVSPRHYSIAIMAAWEVVEKMTEYELHIMSGCNFKRYPNMPYSAKFENKNWSFVALANTAPLAICRAALLTKVAGVEV